MAGSKKKKGGGYTDRPKCIHDIEYYTRNVMGTDGETVIGWPDSALLPEWRKPLPPPKKAVNRDSQ